MCQCLWTIHTDRGLDVVVVNSLNIGDIVALSGNLYQGFRKQERLPITSPKLYVIKEKNKYTTILRKLKKLEPFEICNVLS